MNAFEILIPEASILVGLLVLATLEIVEGRFNFRQAWVVQLVTLSLALLQQLLLYRLPSSLFVRGGMVLDGTTQIFSVLVLALSLLIHLNRKEEGAAAPQLSI